MLRATVLSKARLSDRLAVYRLVTVPETFDAPDQRDGRVCKYNPFIDRQVQLLYTVQQLHRLSAKTAYLRVQQHSVRI